MENCENLNKELIERIKNEYEKADGITRESLERILPELKKPDDNEIREEILECIKYLEKNICHPARYTRKQYESWIAWVEKQGEQKPTSKIEPKFKVGDWIIFNGFILHIDEIVKGYYRTTSIGYGIPNSYDWNIDNVARLWTIQDAKAGDVLVHNDCTFIFIEIKDGIVQALEENLLHGTNPVHFGEPDKDNDYRPATKEQRDLLFKKMKEAGYEWDADKKELKNIEQKPIIKMKSPEESLGVSSEEYNKIVDECIYGDDKSTWDKKDEQILNAAILHIKNETYNYYGGYSSEHIMQWLKSLKDRVQTKQLILEYYK